MITVLLQKIINMLSDHFPTVLTLLSKLNLIEEDTEEIRGNVDSMKTTLEDVDTQATAAAAKLNTINTTVTSIDSNTAAIKTNSDAIKNNILSMSSNVGNIAAYSEDTANNTLDIDQKITSIASDTTDIRTATNDIYDENAKIYDAVKWLLADKEIEETESADNSVTFDTDMAEDLVGLTVGLVATQSGTGDPSPNNIRLINGYSNIGLTVNGNAVSISLGDTYYFGVADVINGNLKLLFAGVDMGNLNWLRYNPDSTNIPVFYASITGVAVGKTNSLCEIFKVKPWETLSARTNWTLCPHPTLTSIYIADSDYTVANDFKTAVTGYKYVYELATPVVISLTPEVIATIKGVNMITTDTNGEIVVTYKESIKHYLDKQEN